MRRLALSSLLAAACSQPAAPPDPKTSTPAAPAWWCTCYTRTGPEQVTSCRKDQAECEAVEQKAATGAGSGMIPGSVTHRCREVRGEHPGDALGGRERWQPAKKPGASLATGACLLPGPADAPPESATHDRSDTQHAERLGALELGLGLDDVRRGLGEPGASDRTATLQANGEYRLTWTYAEAGLVLGFLGPANTGPWRLASIRARTPCTLRTTRGVAVGDPRSSVEAAYGKDLAPDAAPDGRTLVAGSPGSHITFTFELDGRTIAEILLGNE